MLPSTVINKRLNRLNAQYQFNIFKLNKVENTYLKNLKLFKIIYDLKNVNDCGCESFDDVQRCNAYGVSMFNPNQWEFLFKKLGYKDEDELEKFILGGDDDYYYEEFCIEKLPIFQIESHITKLNTQLQENRTEFDDLEKSYNLFTKIQQVEINSRCSSFEEMVLTNEFNNRQFEPIEWEFIFKKMGFTDKEFFTTFIGWNDEIQKISLADRKCCACLEYYSKNKQIQQFNNCSHSICRVCYYHLPKINNLKQCSLCRKFEK